MPDSKTRKAAVEKKRQTRKHDRAKARADKARHTVTPGSRAWVPPTFITVGLLGVLWLVVYYITASAGVVIPWFSDVLGNWNIGIGMGALAAAFVISTFWK
ncbi:MAG: cell division protein CrgA [Propionibacteriaceae bacterium]|nr:cell division protein CrgA [Propionibacteriaceae bacterium]